MRCSLNEVEGLARRAARGAGMPWGLAEEAGKATRWLAERGLPAPALLAELLERNDGRDYDLLAGGVLCPLCTGATLGDRAAALADALPLHLAATACPLLLLPFLAHAARGTGGAFVAGWEGVRVAVTGDALRLLEGDAAALATDATPRLEVAEAPAGATGPAAASAPVEVDDGTWRRLAALAHRTYVPASEASRARGAGAGLSDND